MAKPKAQVSELKKQTVKELTDLVKTKKTILIASIKNIPHSAEYFLLNTQLFYDLF